MKWVRGYFQSFNCPGSQVNQRESEAAISDQSRDPEIWRAGSFSHTLVPASGVQGAPGTTPAQMLPQGWRWGGQVAVTVLSAEMDRNEHSFTSESSPRSCKPQQTPELQKNSVTFLPVQQWSGRGGRRLGLLPSSPTSKYVIFVLFAAVSAGIW